MKLIVGLGNPGHAYARTRHNLGFRVVDRLAEILGASIERQEAHALIGAAQAEGVSLLLAKPQTYMNRSGHAVGELVRRYEIPLEDLLVVLDDLDLPLGTIRIRRKGSAGGHRGLLSVIEALTSTAFPRLRLGIRPHAPIADTVAFVLSPFEPDEEPIVEAMIERAAAAALLWVREGIEKAMAEFNARKSALAEPSPVAGCPEV
ncbi:MAG: aminoacyl-tRNA hydrolase [Blastocatellia bacterium]|nr:aminoacyl-tRNA hydrolase [Blastocatellia bacterium]MCS7156715.1 aminoacyl-tRNA hydrolase [Blastocatellia bacterium]MCX7751543.1 aminoacyl-tRNA hydrolase [Blastocatellia bacterium]MDW8168643.1 aminoacyl-tRNA hydrolase [Acidobacteriota bacterium]MDW8256538.1 aminoacyl-tRNA hydrolase [Acidobacteriota bacterium]